MIIVEMNLNMAMLSTGYNGNPLIKKARQRQDWTADQIEEYTKCALDPIYFAERYMNIIHVDDGMIPIKLYDYQKEIIDKFRSSRRVAVCTSRQAGKALALDTEIPLANGHWTTMGELSVGDIIIGSNGQPTTVTFKSEIHKKPCYKFEFSESDETVIACEDHLWSVWDRSQKKQIIIDTKTLARTFNIPNSRGYNECRYSIQNIKPVHFSEHKPLVIDPYILGCWLGDGATKSNTFTCSVEHKDHYESQGMIFTTSQSYERNSNSTAFTSGIKGIRPHLRELGLLGNKHIPFNYLMSSVCDRVSLLQGLMDTDGFVGTDGACHIQLSTKTLNLINNIKELLVGLGFKVTSSYFAKTESIRLSFNPSGSGHVPVLIPHKIARIKQNSKREKYINSRSITNIELVPIVETQCITVDAFDNLFAFSRDMIITHNTTTATAIILHFILFNEHKTVVLLANKGEAAREILDRIQLSYENLPKWLQQGVVEWNKGKVELENGCKVFAAATSSDSVRGKSAAMIYIDEAAFVEGWDEFFSSTYPTISSGKKTKLLLTSTPNGLNHFYKTCMGAKEKKNGYGYVEVPWYKIPGRDEAWRIDTMQAIDFDEEKFNQEYCCVAASSMITLQHPSTLEVLHLTIGEAYKLMNT